MRRLIIAGNWKMHKTTSQASQLAKDLKEVLNNLENIDIVLCPVFTSLLSASQVISDSCIMLGAQDVYWEQEGAFTGEISI